MRQNDFENTPMLKLVISLAIPSMIAQLVNILYSIVDRMFVGKLKKWEMYVWQPLEYVGPLLLYYRVLERLLVLVVRFGYLCVWDKRMRKGPVKSYITAL